MKKKSQKVLLAVSIVFVLLIAVIASLPILISSSSGREFALRQINQRIPGELMVGSWSLRWLGNMNIQQLAFNDQQGQRLLELSKASISRGLLDLIADHNNLGEIRLVKPFFSVSPSAQSTVAQKDNGVSTPSINGADKKQSKKSASGSKQPPKKEFTLPSIRGTIAIEDGGIQLLSSNGVSQTVVQDLAVELSIDGLDKPISFKLNGTAGAPGSICAGTGTFTLPANGVLDLNKVDADVQLKMKNIDLTPMTEVAGAFSSSPILNGVLNTDIAIVGNLGDGFKIKSEVLLKSLAMPEKKLKFGDIRIELAGNVKKDSADIEKAFVKSGFCNINASGNYGGTGSGAVTATADIDIAATLQLLKELGMVTNDVTCGGKLQAIINGTSKGDIIAVKQADIIVSALDLNYQGKTFKQDAISLSAPLDLNIATRQVNLPEAKLTASLGTITVTSLNIGDWTNMPGSVKTHLKTDIDIKVTRDALSDFISLPDNWGLSGRLKADLDIDFTQPESYKINLNASVPDLRIESTEPPLIIEDTPKLSVDMTTTPKFDVIDIKKALLSSNIIDLELAAIYKNSNGQNDLKLKGMLAPSLTELSRYMDAYADIPVTFAGKKPEPFDFSVNWSGSGDTLKIAGMNGKAGLYADKIDGFGFHVRALTVPVVFKNNKAELSIKAKVNDGDLHLISSIDIGGKNPAIHMPDDLYILKDINITTEVADELLGLINPVFRGISTVDGKMSLLMNSFSWPLSEKEILARKFAGKIIFNDVKLAANGLLTDLLDLVKVGTRELDIGATSIDINCADGKITSSPLHLKVKKYELILDGVVGLDNSLDYHAKVPMTETLVGKSGYKYLEGTSLNIPVGGTVQKPVLNLRSFQSAVSDLVKQATTKALSGELEKQLRKLFE